MKSEQLVKSLAEESEEKDWKSHVRSKAETYKESGEFSSAHTRAHDDIVVHSWITTT